MTAIRTFSSAALALAAFAAYGQDAMRPKPAPVGQAAPAEQPATRADCSAGRKARHDHGIERGYGPMPAKGCSAMTPAKAGATGAAAPPTRQVPQEPVTR